MKMKTSQLDIMRHAIGWPKNYRNHYVIGPGCDGFADCLELAAEGFMADLGPQTLAGGMHCFQVTDAGRQEIAKNEPKPVKMNGMKIKDLIEELKRLDPEGKVKLQVEITKKDEEGDLIEVEEEFSIAGVESRRAGHDAVIVADT